MSFSLGTIRHKVSTHSLNGKISGQNAFDFSPELRYERLFKKNLFAELGLQVNSLSTKFSINQDSQWDVSEAGSKSLYNKGGYLKLFINYKYLIKLNERFNINFLIGPSTNITRIIGYDYDQSTYMSTKSPSGLYINYYYNYSVYKTKRFSVLAQLGAEFQIKTKRKNILFFRLVYNKGFRPFNEVYIKSYIFTQLNDSATLLYDGTGFTFSFGYSYQLFAGQKK